ncbi:MAG: hypothetical protein ACYDHN_01700 [Solirubrobacteraceae bacterium]
MTTIDDLREVEARLRAADSSMHASLRTKRAELETAAADDVAAASAALLAGDEVPKPRAVKLNAEARDIESRQLLAVDDALWQLAGQVREVLRPGADPDYRRRLDRQLLRWQKPDPKNPNVPPQTQHLKRRPKDVVAWVEQGVENIDRGIEEQRVKDEIAERKAEATRRVNEAQADYHRAQAIAYAEEEARMSVTARTAARLRADKNQQPLWPPFDRLAFLRREGLEADYGWVQGGQHIEAKGSREDVSAMHAGPARESTADTSPQWTEA